MNIDTYKRVISKYVTVTKCGMKVAKGHKLTKKEIKGVVGCIKELLQVSKFAVATLVYQLVNNELEAGLSMDAAVAVVVARLSELEGVGAGKGYFSSSQVYVLYRMHAVFPEDLRSERVNIKHYIILAKAMHISEDAARARIAELINAVEHPDPDSGVDTTLRGTEEMVRAGITRRNRATPKELMPVKCAVSRVYKLVCTDKQFNNISTETQDALFGLVTKLNSMTLGAFALTTDAAVTAIVSRREVRVKKSRVKVSKRKLPKKAGRKKSSKRKSGKRKGK